MCKDVHVWPHYMDIPYRELLIGLSICRDAMKYSHLVALLVALSASFGAVELCDETEFQEDCAGEAMLSTGVALWGLRCQRRDVSQPLEKFIQHKNVRASASQLIFKNPVNIPSTMV